MNWNSFCYGLFAVLGAAVNQLYVLANFPFFLYFMPMKEKFAKHKWRNILLIYLGYVIIDVVRESGAFASDSWWVFFTVAFLGSFAAIVFIMFDGKWSQKLFLFVALKVMEIAAAMVSGSLITILVKDDYALNTTREYAMKTLVDCNAKTAVDITAAMFESAVVLMATLVAFNAALAVLIKLFQKYQKKISVAPALVIIPVSQMMLFFFALSSRDWAHYHIMFFDDKVAVAMLITIIIGAIGDIFLIIALNRSERQKELEKQAQVNEERRKYYDVLQKQQLSIREMQHDIDGHVAAVENMICQGNTEAAKEYLEKIKEHRRFQKLNYCDNSAINAILFDIKLKCDEHHIKTDFVVLMNGKNRIDDYDYITILSNLADNAIEAVLALPEEERCISVKIEDAKGCITIVCENPVSNNGTEAPQHLASSKLSHGNGKNILQKTAAKYGGSTGSKCENGKYRTTVFLYK